MTKILVVEDEASFSDALAYLLGREGFDVSVADTGTGAIEEFDRHGADLILLDLMLGGTNRSIAFPFPRAHIHNLLGSPSSIQFSQQGSCVYLGFVLALAAGLTLAKTEP